MQRVKSFFEEFFFKPSIGYPLAAIRIVIAYMVISEFIFIYPNIEDLYGQYGYFQTGLMDALNGMSLPGLMAHLGFTGAPYVLFLRGFYILHLILAILLLLGIRTRYVAVALWMTQTLIVNSGYVSVYGVHRYLHNLIFLTMWMPTAQVWSLDRWLSGRTPEERKDCTASLRLLQIYLLLTYVGAGTSKALGTDWWDGQAIWAALNLPEFRHFNFYWMAQVPWLPKLLSLGTLFIETFYIVGAWIPRIGRLWVISIVMMHIGIAVGMGLTLFGTSMALVNVALFLVPQRPSQERSWVWSGISVREMGQSST
jgi:hypothetical protein